MVGFYFTKCLISLKGKIIEKCLQCNNIFDHVNDYTFVDEPS